MRKLQASALFAVRAEVQGRSAQARAQTGMPQSRPMRAALITELRAAWRLGRVCTHVAWGAAVIATTFRWRSLDSQRRARQKWAQQLLACLGVRLAAHGAVPQGGLLLVANHVSWIDIFVINALRSSAFVCKEEVRSWPLVGWLTSNSETIFIRRGSRKAAHQTAQDVVTRLQQGAAMVVFPEGTTTNGTQLLPFRPAILQAAVDAQTALVPVAIRYRDAAHAISPAPAYDGDISMWQCLRAITRAEGLVAEAQVHAALDWRSERAELARQAQQCIAQSLALAPPQEP